MATASHVHVIGAGLAGLSAAVALSEAGRTRHGPGSRTGRRRAVPVVFRPRTRPAHRQRQPSAAVRQSRRLRLSGHDRGAADPGHAGSAGISLYGRQQRPDLDAAAEHWPDPVVGPVTAGGACRARVLSTTSRSAGSRPRPAMRRSEPWCAPARYIAGWSNRSRQRRSTRLRMSVWHGCSARSSARRCCAAAAPASLPCRREGLSESLVDPAVTWLRARGNDVLFGHRVAALRVADSRVAAVQTTDGAFPVGAVVLAVPPWVAVDLLPGLPAPTDFQAIINVHFRIDADRGPGRLPGPDRRHRGVGVRQARPCLGDDQRSQPHRGPGRRAQSRPRFGPTCGLLSACTAPCRRGGW